MIKKRHPFGKIFLAVALMHVCAVMVLYWPQIDFVFASLFGWGFAFLGAQEPTPTRSPLHPDVVRAEKTALGRKLLHREKWIIERPFIALGLILVISQVAALLYIVMSERWESQVECVRIALISPVVMLAAGFVLAQIVNMWVVTGPLLAILLLFLIAGIIHREWFNIAKLTSSVVGVAASLWMIDLLRGIRRGWRHLG